MLGTLFGVLGAGFPVPGQAQPPLVEDKFSAGVSVSSEPISYTHDGETGLELWSFHRSTEPVLPVELTAFDGAQIDEGTVRLTWTTASEHANAGFRIQHKAPSSAPMHAEGAERDGWTTLGRLDGAGTTHEPHTHRFTVEDLSAGTHQFRLEQVDMDGTTSFARPIAVDVQMQDALQLSRPAPNPVRHQATLSCAVKDARETTVRLYNMLGQQIATLYDGTPTAGETQTVELSATDLPSGVYVVRLQTGDRSMSRRVTIVR